MDENIHDFQTRFSSPKKKKEKKEANKKKLISKNANFPFSLPSSLFSFAFFFFSKFFSSDFQNLHSMKNLSSFQSVFHLKNYPTLDKIMNHECCGKKKNVRINFECTSNYVSLSLFFHTMKRDIDSFYQIQHPPFYTCIHPWVYVYK